MEPRTCDQCKQSFAPPNTGRPKRFCSPRCRLVNHRQAQKAKRGLSIPTEVSQQDRWVRHIRKRPVTVTGHAASVTSPSSWASLPEVLASKAGDGIGFVLGEGIGCIDLDDCFTTEGRLSPEAERILADVGSTWVEVSPSGRGLHVWGRLAEGPGRVRVFEGQKVETYSRARYMTITGDLWGGAPLQLGPLPTLS